MPAVVDSVNRPKGLLLIIHGTFSLGRAIFDQLNAADNQAGREFLAWASTRYEHVLSFEHPTLSVSPVLNGLDLARLFASVQSPVDVICHSRGGLVTRWWLEAFEGAKHGTRRVVFVAAPLGGTSLASPVKLREAMNLFTSVGSHIRDAFKIGSAYLPFLNVGTMLAQVVVMATGTLAKTPLSDLFFNAVPGLSAMSPAWVTSPSWRGSEVDHTTLPPPTTRSAPTSAWRMPDGDFGSTSRRSGSLNRAQDQIFDQANDLVVDNRSAIELFQGLGLRSDHYLNLTRNGKVHHTNYFTDSTVISKLCEFLA